jgi:beta-glucanase (GH16 family)
LAQVQKRLLPPNLIMINRRKFISLACCSAALMSCASAPPPAARRTSYAFADDFDGPAGSAPDPSRWAYDTGGGGWGNRELETYSSSRENSFLDGKGNLVIRATKHTLESPRGTFTTYQSARLKTLGKFAKYHGNFEARIKLDPQPGLWPAWWAMGANIERVGWPACGEVDMLENFGNDLVRTSVHTPDGKKISVLTSATSVPVDDDWHIWRMSWGTSADGFTFFRDGLIYFIVDPSEMPYWCFSSGVPMFMLLNLAVGGAAGTPPESVRFPIDMLVDYVRVW